MTFYRRNLPHWHPEGESIFLTWRLFGSLPASVFKETRAAKDGGAAKESAGKRFKRLDSLLEQATTGPLWLTDARVANFVVETIRRGERPLGYFDLHAYVVMPNHVHLLITPKIPVARITNGIKGSTSRRAKSVLKLRAKHFWQDESFDHWVRSSQEFNRARAYIEWNPVSAGLVPSPEDWPWSSASGTAIPGCAEPA